ncbi:methyltransferase type 12 [Thalassospira tepidiphila]|uniref:methyltransferase type 12 n=1 Tax=Thalassospira tepidiphila TaxID=393657 RepID=UPI0030C736AC
MTSQALPQSPKYPVSHIWHADWSLSAKGRWVAKATRTEVGWQIHAIEPVGMLHQFRQSLANHGKTDALWLGLDMPIGFLDTWYDGANVKDLMSLLRLLETGEWQEFFDVCQSPDEIRHTRPFYPQSSGIKGSVKRDHLIKALDLTDFDDLHRACEFPTTQRNAACPPFWTLGANQVGKGMLHGLKHLIMPGHADGFNIWPFSGDLGTCCKSPGVTLIETYPGEIYGWLTDTSELTKSIQESRKKYLHQLRDNASKKGIEISPSVWADISDGFGPDHGKDDAFDALIGVMGLIEIAEGRRPEHLPRTPSVLNREGWIVGLNPNDIKPRKS